ncbi:hypothetical protein C1H46_030890 [Malus baccata]|uniref:Uncharacterized protein n=1 Tax=Malus baccata TaxID=106549 RepID=A0A540LAT1_MALBA|nr:hypothetical protein C1H46_030890 [Malus baccata]
MRSRTRDLLEDFEAEGEKGSTLVMNLVPIVDAINSCRFRVKMNSFHKNGLDRLQFLTTNAQIN